MEIDGRRAALSTVLRGVIIPQRRGLNLQILLPRNLPIPVRTEEPLSENQRFPLTQWHPRRRIGSQTPPICMPMTASPFS
ncbi:hypothetical protein I7I50_11903 [Histoplasma capsulatum G186AR]|uniref:Uncharacterized protein n=1 Tax=Ajellomyces capsulatus TaxID=5037 RepID=A0A8H7YAV6_AJECA|nr:hypothetical protein I7I52_11785 [Histoplasma capsulatum]QSS70313.1 hypothetical protein I7I50_11903 [Histoplasma capsulatum G186AR]